MFLEEFQKNWRHCESGLLAVLIFGIMDVSRNVHPMRKQLKILIKCKTKTRNPNYIS